jgi:hypothetical protein
MPTVEVEVPTDIGYFKPKPNLDPGDGFNSETAVVLFYKYELIYLVC